MQEMQEMNGKALSFVINLHFCPFTSEWVMICTLYRKYSDLFKTFRYSNPNLKIPGGHKCPLYPSNPTEFSQL